MTSNFNILAGGIDIPIANGDGLVELIAQLDNRYDCEDLGNGLYRHTITFGMSMVNVPVPESLLAKLCPNGETQQNTVYYSATQKRSVMPKLVIEGELIEVGTKWSGETFIEIQHALDADGQRQTMDFVCSREDAIAFGKHLYQPVTVTVEVEGVFAGNPNVVSADLVEALAKYAHEAWAGWMSYLFSKSPNNDDGTWTMPKEFVDRWRRQMSTPYAELPEGEKWSDREEAIKILKIVRRVE